MRRKPSLGIVVLLVSPLLVASAIAACVSDAPPLGGADAGADQAVSDALPADVTAPDAGGGDSTPNDGGVSDAPPDVVVCRAANPMLFPPALDAGVYCSGVAPASHCAKGLHCCVSGDGGADHCAASCPGELDIACYNPTDCSGQTCCMRGIVDLQACAPQTVIRSFTGSTCMAGPCASGAFQGCAAGSDCASAMCTAAYALDKANHVATGIQIGHCNL